MGREGHAIIPDPAVNLMPHRHPAPRRGVDTEPVDARRFSPLNAPQRAAVEAFCSEARPWAARQAKRTYRHLPEGQLELAVDEAIRALRRGAPRSVDRRTLYAELSRELTDSLRRIHAGWCLNEAQGVWRREGLVLVPDNPVIRDTAHAVAAFVEDGLGGLERAVLQLEIGAGRDTRTTRAALKLGPRQYQRHREEGLSKLRGAIAGHAAGQVCEHHLEAVTQAATGDRSALDSLASGPDRCRSCAREATGLRRVLQERLAVAPWPLAIKPAGVVATKLGILGALAGGKGAGAGVAALSAGPISSGTGAMATVIAAAALATGASAVIEHQVSAPSGGSSVSTNLNVPAAPSAIIRLSPATTTTRGASGLPSRRTTARAKRRRPGGATAAPATGSPTTATTQTSPASTAPSGNSSPASSGGPGASTTKPSVGETTQGVVNEVRKTVDPVVAPIVDPVIDALPAPVASPLQGTLDKAQDSVDRVTGAVGGLLP
jgi:hypothetical protein